MSPSKKGCPIRDNFQKCLAAVESSFRPSRRQSQKRTRSSRRHAASGDYGDLPFLDVLDENLHAFQVGVNPENRETAYALELIPGCKYGPVGGPTIQSWPAVFR